MPLTSLAVVLLLLNSVASLAVVDPSSLVLNDQPPNPSLNEPLDHSMTSFSNNDKNSPLPASVVKPPPNDALPPLAADVTKFSNNMVQANNVLGGTADEAGATYFGDDQISNGASNECLTDQPNARKRVRRGCITLPTIQQNPTFEGTRKPKEKEKMTGEPVVPAEPELVTPFYIDTPTSPATKSEPSNSDFGIPEPVYWMCNPLEYGMLNTPMCDSGVGKLPNQPQYIGSDIQWFSAGTSNIASLNFAVPWTVVGGCKPPAIIWCCQKVLPMTPYPRFPDIATHVGVFQALICVVYRG
ncbi:hypothetical protein MMC22_010363 [Lobaria immixta]|nr:hypothetical protein [Lobaria immixta]